MIGIIDYGVGNLYSVAKALATCGTEVIVTRREQEIRAADKLVLPGVGAFGDCMQNLTDTGLIPLIKELIAAGKPLLGICVGLQILFEESEESPGVKGLGIFAGKVRKIRGGGLKIPHIGWNDIQCKDDPLLEGLGAKPYVYFVHSYFAEPKEGNLVIATTHYGEEITAAVRQGNVMATQFHPEKSGDVGLCIIKNFLALS